MGERAEESGGHAKNLAWKRCDSHSKAGRSRFDSLPIFHLTFAQVFNALLEAGKLLHPAYGMGMSRLPYVFCTMASRADVRTVTQLQTALHVHCVRLEERIGHTLSPSGVPLPVLTGVGTEPAPGGCRFEPSAFPLA